MVTLRMIILVIFVNLFNNNDLSPSNFTLFICKNGCDDKTD